MDIKINGQAYDQSSVKFTANNLSLITVQDISTGSTLKPGSLKGASSERVARTKGEAEHDLSFSLGMEEADEYLNSLGDGYGETEHDIVITYRAKGSRERKIEILSARVTSAKEDTKGTDAAMVKFEIDVFRRKVNGLSITKET